MITIFTPVYNRIKELSKLKSSIDKQTDHNFEWVIVDDGSNDGVENLVDEWCKEELGYTIIFKRQNNQGKHIAHNLGVELSNFDWFICVDSDDMLKPNAVEIMNSDILTINQNIPGVVYPRENPNFSNDLEWSKIDNSYVDIIDLKEKYGIPESAILLNKKYILELLFPKLGDERFLPEGWLYQKLISKGKFLVHNKLFYSSIYLDSGLTNNIWKLWANNPKGILDILQEKYMVLKKYKFSRKWFCRVKCIMNINAICLETDEKIFETSPSKLLSVILFIPSVFIYLQRYK
ncbi:MAG: glycosyltransferase family 2 protein [Bacteroidales bacterium]|nr:glycosyltransferase family 2 protein [Bacteroidales bacterium]